MTAPNMTVPNSQTTQPSSTEPGTGASSSQNAEPWRQPAGPGVPAWAVGKTAQEILDIGMRFETIARSATPIQSQVQPQPQAQQPQMSPDDYVTAAQLNQWGQEAARAVAAPAMEANAQLAWRMVQQEHPEIFQRYAPEALELWAKLPVHQRTLEGAQMVVKLVKGEHARELAQVYASGGSGEPSLGRSGGGPAPNAANGGAPNSGRVSILDDERIPLEWRQKAKERGITDEVVDEFTRAYPGMTREDYIKKYLIRSAGG